MLLRSLRNAPIERAVTQEAHEWLGQPYDPRGPFWGLGVVPGALALPAFYRGLQHRQTTVSTLPLVAEVNGRRINDLPPLLAQPDPLEDRQVTLSRLETSMTLRGEALAVLGDWDSDGFPQALTVVDPAGAQLDPDSRQWTINGGTYARDEVLHLLPMALPGEARGVSVVELYRRLVTGELSANDFHRRFYTEGGVPTTVVSIEEEGITPSDLEMYSATWRTKVAGSREPVFVPGSTKVSPLFISNRDAQWLEGRQWAITDIAHVVGVPPYYLGAPGTSSTYSNVSDERRAFLDLYLRSDMYAIERGFTNLLPGGVEAKFFTESFLRLDPKATADMLLVETNWMTLDEVRAVQGLAPLPDGRGKRLVADSVPGASQPGQQSAPGGTLPNPDEGGD